MGTKKKKATLDESVKNFLGLKSQSERLASQAADIKKDLMAKVESWGSPDERGNLWYELSDPITVSVWNDKKGEYVEKTVARLKRERRPETIFEEDDAMTLLEEKGLVEEGTITFTVVDQDALYRLQQEGKLTEAELRNLFTYVEKYAFVPIA